ncbi:hypothetical protein CB1_001108077 [Camelus ferus]|nr:hypothetical protein CB1_001108077 [Camelus ferus]
MDLSKPSATKTHKRMVNKQHTEGAGKPFNEEQRIQEHWLTHLGGRWVSGLAVDHTVCGPSAAVFLDGKFTASMQGDKTSVTNPVPPGGKSPPSNSTSSSPLPTSSPATRLARSPQRDCTFGTELCAVEWKLPENQTRDSFISSQYLCFLAGYLVHSMQ